MRTLIAGFIVVDMTITIVMVVLHFQIGRRYSGTFLWVVNFLFQTLNVLLIAMRGLIPDFLSIVVSNALGMSGTLFGLAALYKFFGLKRSHWFNLCVLLIFLLVLINFSIVKPDLRFRNLNFAVTMLILSAQYMLFVFRDLKGESRTIARGVGIVFAGYSLVNVIRVIYFFTYDNEHSDYFHSGLFEMFVFVAYQVLFIFLTYNLALMYNKRLLSDIGVEEEKYSKIFNSSPYAVLVTSLKDGRIIEVNPGFERMAGYSREEAIGKTTVDLNIWITEEERKSFITKLSVGEEVIEEEKNFRIKSGKIITGLISSQLIYIKETLTIISSINDITDKKNSEILLREKIQDIEKLNKFMTGRELRMIELKKEVNELCVLYGLPRKYDSGKPDEK